MKILIYSLILFLLAGCNYLEDYSQDLVVVKHPSDLDELLLGSGYIASRNMVDQLNKGQLCWWLHVLDDDVNTAVSKVANGSNDDLLDKNVFGYFAWQLEVGREMKGDALAGDATTWNALYRHINSVNVMLGELVDMTIEDPDDQLIARRVEGECRFLRAQFYLMLVNLYANAYHPSTAMTTLGVPLKLTNYVEHDPVKESQFERAPVYYVYRQIVEDLELSINCFRQSPQKHGYYRASERASLLLLSRVYLYMQEWENARETARLFLESGAELADLSTYAQSESGALLTTDNPEVIFSQGVLNLQKAFTAKGGNMCLSEELGALYDPLKDYRYGIYFVREYETQRLALNRKYETGDDASRVSDLFMLRTAEGYLNMAEACAMLMDAAEASKWLNELRRMRIQDYQDVTYGVNEIVEQVRTERRKELCLEGHRWFDLRRYAVCTDAPFKKVIRHEFACYNWEFYRKLMYVRVYELPEDDPAYTFAIPKDVLKFDTGMEDNQRDAREYKELIMAEDIYKPEEK